MLSQGPHYIGHGHGITGALGINGVAVNDYETSQTLRLSHPHVSWNILFPFGYVYNVFKGREVSSRISRSAVVDAYLRA